MFKSEDRTNFNSSNFTPELFSEKLPGNKEIDMITVSSWYICAVNLNVT